MRVIAPSQNTQHRCLHSAPGTLRVRARRVPGPPPEFHGDLRLGHLTIGNLMPQIGTARRLPWFTRSLAYRPTRDSRRDAADPVQVISTCHLLLAVQDGMACSSDGPSLVAYMFEKNF